MKERISVSDCMVALPGAGRRTLLALLSRELCLPASQQLCLLDASRLEDPEQLDLLRAAAEQRAQRNIVILNQSELVEDPQALVEQTLTLLRQQGFDAVELYPVCAEAARLFRAAEAGDNTAEAEAFCAAYARFAPGDNVLPGLALCGRAPICIGGLHLSREQLQLALENTGIPLLEARLRELACEPGECPSPELLNTLPEEAAEPEAPLRAQTQETAPAPENAALRPAANDSPAEVPASPTEAPDSPTLASVRELAARADCAELLAAAKAVNAGELAVDDRERVLNLLHTTYLERTNTELEALVSDVESRSLPELLELQERINNGPYPVQKRTPYLERVTVWIERHQKEQLRAICAGIETATQRELEEITGQLSAEPCAEVLKQEFYDRIAERKTDLDREALDRVVEGAEQKSLKELQAISVTLQASNWNQELVTAYRHRIELLKEAAVFRELQEQLINL
ncbi:MAG: hypothetical protein IIY70_00330, partial [Oscillospiraceae bacterium]|nr:hypothetical protein [Oscillospiraceae bacterium]